MSKLDKLATLIPMEELENEAQQQIFNALGKPFLRKLAVMPDCHAGYDLPIGGVALLDHVISPSYTGFDIGCGMCFIDTLFKADDLTPEYMKEIWQQIKTKIPTGEGRERQWYPYKTFPNSSGSKELMQKVQAKIHTQIGTLGGGR